jgi:WD40 repeat protein
VDEWFIGNEHESKILLLTAGPGFGKSVFAAKVCEDFSKKGKLAACHFCDFSDSNLRNPMMMLQSLASQMCENVVGFKEKLLDQLQRPHKVRSLKDAFGIYLQNPLDELEEEEPSLIVIDGLDESTADDKNEIVNLIADYFPDLPDFIKVLITSRPGISVAKLKGLKKINIESNDADNNSDLEIYLRACLPSLPDRKEDNHPGIFETLVRMCEGSFLYAFHAQSELQKRDDLQKVTFDQIIEFLPKGLDAIYQAYFKRLEDEFKTIIGGNLDVLKVLEVLVASKAPLPLTFVSRALGLAPDCRETKKIIKKVNETVSSLLYVSDDLVTVFHKSVTDWILARGYQDHEYTVKVDDGDKSLWLICEQIFEEIKDNVGSGHDLNLTNDAEYALDYGFAHLVACDMKECFSWLVDVVIIHVLLTISPDKWLMIRFILKLWNDILRVDAVISYELRARISWHIIEIEFIVEKIITSSTDRRQKGPRIDASFCYLQSVLTHSPKGYFSDNEKKITKLLLSMVPRFVDFASDEVEVMPLAIWCCTSRKTIKAVGMSKDKTMAAVAQTSGRISVVCLPSLVELWQYSFECCISCCVFAPDDSFVLFGKLETALNIAERKEVPFFHRHKETFKSCAFSPNGKRLVTSNGSSTIKLWNVAEQTLLSLLCAEIPVNWCSFNNTGTFIIGNRKSDARSYITTFADYSLSTLPNNNEDKEDIDFEDLDFYEDEEDFEDEESDAEDLFCVWNAITSQRCDERSLTERKLEEGKVFQSKLCKRCFRPGFEKPLTYKILDFEPYTPLESRETLYKTWSTGIYNGVECSFVFSDQSVSVIENTHFTTLAAWNCFFDGHYNYAVDSYHEWKIFREVTAIEDNLWLYADVKKLIFFRTLVPTCPTRVLCSSFSPDCSQLATCTSDGCVNIWNVNTRQVEQRFKCSRGESPFACWWSEKFLFVFEFLDRIPSLSKYSVNLNLKIMFSQSQQVSLCHLADEFVPLSSVVSFSEGFLCFECGNTKLVKVVDVNGVGGPRMVTLPGIEPKMSITVSPGASFVFGDKECREKKPLKVLDDRFAGMRIVTRSPPMLYGFNEPGTVFVGADNNKYYIWKKNSEEPTVYELFFTQPDIPLLQYNRGVISCFSNDSKVVVIAYRLLGRRFVHSKIIDLDTGKHKYVLFKYSGLNSKLFCINKYRLVIAASDYYISILDMDSGAFLGCSFQRYFTRNLLMKTKLSPNGTTLAFPKVNGDMEFLRLCITQNPLLSSIKQKAGVEWDDYRKALEDGVPPFLLDI